MSAITPEDLTVQWRADARTHDDYQSAQAAAICRLHADQLEAALRAIAETALTLRDAARASGYSVDRVRHMVADGLIPNSGTKGAPRILKRHLPNVPGAVRAYDDPAAVEARQQRKRNHAA